MNGEVKRDNDHENEIENEIEPCLLMESNVYRDIELVSNMLTENNIRFFTKSDDFIYLKMLNTGSSFYNTCIYVDKSDYEKAKTFVEVVTLPPEGEEEFVPLEDSSIKSIAVKKFIVRLTILLILGISLLVFFLSGSLQVFFR